MLAALTLLSLAAPPASAHDPKDKWRKKLELTDEQSTKLEALKKEHKAALEPLRKEGKELKQALKKLVDDEKASDKDLSAALEKLQKNREAVHAEHKRFIEKAKSVLTPRQQAKAALMMMKKHGRGGWGKRGRGKDDDE